jgi:PAS domain S-box-containing protein
MSKDLPETKKKFSEIPVETAEKTNATSQLEFNDNRFRALVEQGRDIITLWDAQGNNLYRSPSFTKTLGYTSEEMDKRGMLEDVYPDDIQIVQETLQELMTKPGAKVCAVWRQRHKNGEWLWMEGSAHNLLHDPSVKAIVHNFRDVTAQKEANEKIRLNQQRFKSLIEKGKDAIAIISRERKITYLSPSSYNILGYTEEELLGVWSTGLIHPDDAVFSDERVAYLSAAPNNFLKFETRMRHKNGSWVWIEATLTNQTDDPAVNGIVINYHDITEHKKALQEIDELNQSLEKKVNERTQELQEANKLLESYNYSVAHDLKSPLRIIAGYGRVLSDGAKDRLLKQDHELLDVIISNSKKMAQLVTDLLDFTQVNQDKIRPELTDMDTLVAEVMDAIKQADVAPFAKVSLHKLGDSFCDGRLMKQVWTNLISNAFKYSKQNPEPEVEIGSETIHGMKVYYVKDNGVGFDNEYAENLFDVFYRFHKEKEFEGTGVGLALAKSVITHHGGKIWAEGETGKGATFKFYLPEESN